MKSSLYQINPANFNEYLYSIDICINSLNSIYFILESFQSIRNNPHIEAIKLLQIQLEGATKSIETQKSYKLFCELIGVNYKLNNEILKTVPVLILAEAITPQNVPLLPWKTFEDNDFLIYEDNVEKSYYEYLKKNKSKLVEDKLEYSFSFKFDKNYLSVINEMRKHPRSKEILNLYQNILLIEDFKKYTFDKTYSKLKEEAKKLYENKINSYEFLVNTAEYFFNSHNIEDIKIFFSTYKKIEDFEIFTNNLKKSIERDEHDRELFISEVIKYLEDSKEYFFKAHYLNIGETRINKDLSMYKTSDEVEYQNKKQTKISLDNSKKKVKKLFEHHFKETRHYLQNEGYINRESGIEDLKWNELQRKLIIFGDNLLTIEKNFKSTLVELDNFIKSKNEKEKKKNKLFREIHEFLLDRNLNPIKEDNSRKFPSASQIARKKPGGSGILKKITDYGGLPKFEKEYYVYLEKNKNNLKPLIKQIDPNTLSDSVVRPTLKLLQKSVENNKK